MATAWQELIKKALSSDPDKREVAVEKARVGFIKVLESRKIVGSRAKAGAARASLRILVERNLITKKENREPHGALDSRNQMRYGDSPVSIRKATNLVRLFQEVATRLQDGDEKKNEFDDRKQRQIERALPVPTPQPAVDPNQTPIIRVYMLTRELRSSDDSVDNSEILSLAARLGIAVRNHMSALAEEDIIKIKRAYDRGRMERLVDKELASAIVKRKRRK